MGAAICAETITGVSEVDSIIDNIFNKVEALFINNVHPLYLRARADPFLSKVMFALFLIIFINIFICNLFSCVCGMCCKVN